MGMIKVRLNKGDIKIKSFLKGKRTPYEMLDEYILLVIYYLLYYLLSYILIKIYVLTEEKELKVVGL